MTLVTVASSLSLLSQLAWASPITEVQPPGTEDTCAGQPSLEFVEPSDGAMLDSPITVSYIVRQACNCDTGGCYDGSLSNPELQVNGQYFPLDGLPIMVALPAGEHELLLSGEANFHTESASINITIVNGSETSGGGESTEAGSKCSLSETDERGGATVLALGLLLLGLRRRRANP